MQYSFLCILLGGRLPSLHGSSRDSVWLSLIRRLWSMFGNCLRRYSSLPLCALKTAIAHDHDQVGCFTIICQPLHLVIQIMITR